MKYIIFISFFLINTIAIAQNKKITLDDIWRKGTFRQEGISGFKSMNDGKHYSEINKNNELVKVEFESGKSVLTIVNFGDLKFAGKNIDVQEYEFNTKENKLLLFTEGEQIYRHSALYNVYIYDIETKNLQPVFDKKIMHASFSPLSDKVAYVFENNLYFYNLTSKETISITKDGNKNIINGNCDWVYEEEFGFTKAFEWSPDGLNIAYYRFDQTEVPEYNFSMYENLYPTDYKYKYPKAGENNSKIQLGIYSIVNKKDKKIEAFGCEYIPRIKWNHFNNQLIVYCMNRLQNRLELVQVNPTTFIKTSIFEESNSRYIEINDNITFLKKRNAFVYTSEKSGYNHIYFYDVNAQKSTAITRGNFDIDELYGVSPNETSVFYSSTEKSPLERNLYSSSIDGKTKKIITPEKGTHAISFSKTFDYYLDNFSNSTTAPIYSINSIDGKTNRMLKNNEALTKKMKEFELSPLKFITVKNEQGDDLNAWIIEPTNKISEKKYPLLMFQYSGPNSQQVANKFQGGNFWWYQMLAQQGYAIACVDGRGTGFRGEEFRKCTYKQLGKLESDDQIFAAKEFAKMDIIDKDRIGIWGWSYGGYMSSICIMKGADVFKTAIAVAPVTNWRYYDNIYTERYMRTPQENPTGYDENSPVFMTKKLKGNYLLIHGTADDNVHYQNAIEMQNALINDNKEFDSEAYPNKNHGIYGGNTRYHLYNKMTKFLLEKL
ncbi:MAG: S9 family peptidase [Chitinophagaceae bacterium]|nr:S9 family peptidase [Chitinophagaceae bacterium]